MSTPIPVSTPALAATYREVREFSDRLSEPLAPEDCVVQTMADVSPTKWHLAHVTWFFETFLLSEYDSTYCSPDERYAVLFNSYYNAVGDQFPRPRRGLLTRPTMRQIAEYREHVDRAMSALLERRGDEAGLVERVVLGLHHEQQHQELLLMDIKHVFSINPILPAYLDRAADAEPGPPADELRWIDFPGGIVSIGHDGPDFAYDNEGPRHDALVRPFRMADRLVTNAEYAEFVADGGYDDARHWLADGWAIVRNEGWNAPLYWHDRDGEWFEFRLDGVHPLEPAAPVCHVSFYEALAYATWRGDRLASEFEWESVARDMPVEGHFVDSGALHPRPAPPGACGVKQLYGDVWEWTRSAYAAYPGYRAPAGAIGEYNGKFMCNQIVLRGGSAVTSRSHIRPTYRNFFYPSQRWQFAGIRLVRDVG